MTPTAKERSRTESCPLGFHSIVAQWAAALDALSCLVHQVCSLVRNLGEWLSRGNGGASDTLLRPRLALDPLEPRIMLNGTAEIHGAVWNDLDGDGLRDANEPGLEGWMVYLDENGNGLRDTGALDVASTDVPQPIEDHSTAASELTIDGLAGTVSDLNVGLNITHTFDSDLSAFLTSPAGTRIELFSRVDGSGNNFVDTVLDDEAAMGIEEGDAPFTGTFRPEEALTAFDGEDPNGTWTLEVSDSAGGDSGTLNGWQLALTHASEPSTQTGGGGSYAFTELEGGTYTVAEVVEGNWSQTFPEAPSNAHTVTLTQDGSATDIDFGNRERVGEIRGSKWHDLDGDGERDDGEPGIEGWTVFLDVDGNGALDPQDVSVVTDVDGHYSFSRLEPGTYRVAEALPEGWVRTYPDDPGVHVVSVEAFAQEAGLDFGNLKLGEIHGVKWDDLDGDGARDPDEPGLEGWTIYLDGNQNGVFDVETLDVASTDVPQVIDGQATAMSELVVDGVAGVVSDLDVVLTINHTYDADVSVSLVSPAGTRLVLFSHVDGSGDDFADTVLDDEADGSIVDGVAPFSGMFRPEGSLAVFDGEDPNGTWTLEVSDSYAAADDGILDGWGLRLTHSQERSTETGADGSYSFIGLDAGSYTVAEVVESDWAQTYPPGPAPVHTVTLALGDSLTGIDFGNRERVGAIRGSKWHDLDGDGEWDGAEPGLEGRTIYLDENGNGVLDPREASTATGADGNYSFSRLQPGTYRVAEVLPEGWARTHPDDPGTHTVTIEAFAEEAGMDFGNVELGEIQGVKWHDLDGDGARDPDEPGLEGWTIYLDENQNGLFDGQFLSVGSGDTPLSIDDHSTVRSDLTVSGFAGNVTDLDVTLNITHTYDRDLSAFLTSPTGTRVELFSRVDGSGNNFVDTVLDDEAGIGIEAGNAPFTGSFRPEGPLSAFDFEDPNGTWTLEISDSAGGDRGTLNGWELTVVASEPFTQSGADGTYSFTNLLAGTYTVAEVMEANWAQTYPLEPAQAYAVTLALGDSATGIDFGNRERVGEIRGRKWHDLDGDGDWDDGELGIEGWTVFLDENGDGELDPEEVSAATDADGDYSFSRLQPGTYLVAEVLPEGWVRTYPDDPGVHTVTIEAFAEEAGIDFGNLKLGEIRGTKWNDLNGDGVRQPDEPGLEGWTIYLDENGNGALDDEVTSVDSSDVPVHIVSETTVTSEVLVTGFAGVVGDLDVLLDVTHTWDADLRVSLTSPTGTKVRLLSHVGDSDDNFADTILDDEASTGIAEGSAPFTGRFRPAESLTAFDGEDPNGIWCLEVEDTYEEDHGWLEGWGITLAGWLEPYTETATDGSYAFTYLPAGTYAVAELGNPNWAQTVPGESGNAHTVVLSGGEEATGIDFGNRERLGEIGGNKWHDLNGDGERDDGEPGLEGWTVYLDRDSDGELDDGEESTLTTADGTYAFTGLRAGTYRVTEAEQAGWVTIHPVESHVHTVVLEPDEVETGVDFGNLHLAEIHGTKWHDIDEDGTRDPDEPGLEGWIIYLDENQNGALDGGPGIRSTDVPKEIVDGEITSSELVVSGFDGVVGDLDVELDITHSFVADLRLFLVSPMLTRIELFSGVGGEEDDPQDFTGTVLDDEAETGVEHGEAPFTGRFRPQGSLSIFDGEDPNGTWTLEVEDTVLDDSDWSHYFPQWLDGWGLRLRSTGAPGESEQFTETRADGTYSFFHLGAGAHTVAESSDPNWAQTYPEGGDGAYILNLELGQVADAIDFGNRERRGEIRGRAWHDLDGDGSPSEGEPGLEGWTIFLDDNENRELDADEAATVTALDGTYAFPGLWPGTYQVAEVRQEGWFVTTPVGAGGHGVVLVPDGEVAGVDFGVRQMAEIQGAVWHDLNANGERDEGDVGLEGWRVYLDENRNGVFDGEVLSIRSTDSPQPVNDLLVVRSSLTLNEFTGPVCDVDVFVDIVHPAPGDLSVSLIGPGDAAIELLSGMELGVSGAGYAVNAVLDDEAALAIEDWGGSGAGRFRPTEPLATLDGEDVNGTWVLEVTDSREANNGMLQGWGLVVTGASEPFTYTAEDGSYTLIGLEPGTHSVAEIAEGNWAQTTAGPSGSTYTLELASGEVADGISFGNAQVGRVSGTVWYEGEEPFGIMGWTVYLDDNGNGVLDPGEPSTLTDVDGHYSFVGLDPGTYRVAQVVPAGWEQSGPEPTPFHNVSIGLFGASEEFDFHNRSAPRDLQISRELTHIIAGSGAAEGFDVCVEWSTGDAFITGSFSGTIDFDPGQGTDFHKSNGETDIFVTRLNSDGSYGWTRTMGGPGPDCGRGLTVDDIGGLFISGHFANTVDFDSTDGVDQRTSHGVTDIFVAKLYTDGGYGWAQAMGGEGPDSACGVVLADWPENIYLAGHFSETVDFDPGGVGEVHSANGLEDIFVTKLSPVGSHLWTRCVGGEGSDVAEAIADWSAVTVTGSFSRAVDFDPTEEVDMRVSNGAEDVFALRLDADGDYGWTWTVGGAGTDRGLGIAVEPGLSVAGCFSDTVDFDPGDGSDLRASNGMTDAFVARGLSGDGAAADTLTIGGIGPDAAHDICWDWAENAFVVGRYTGSVDVDPSPGTEHHTPGGEGTFLIGLQEDGNTWTRVFDGAGSALTAEWPHGVLLTGCIENGHSQTTTSAGDDGDGASSVLVKRYMATARWVEESGAHTNGTLRPTYGWFDNGLRLCFVDIDDDGDFDFYSGGSAYLNAGSARVAAWSAMPREYHLPWDEGLAPAFSDIDADGDLDLFFGRRDGTIDFYRNVGWPESPRFVIEATNYAAIDVEGPSSPALIDIDSSGTADLFVGTGEGKVHFYRNVGSPQSPEWTLVSDYFAEIDVSRECSPAFADIDGDGAPELFVAYSGEIECYQNQGGSWVLVDGDILPQGWYFGGSVSTAFVDIDIDGDLDLFVGDSLGYSGPTNFTSPEGVTFFVNEGTATSPTWSDPDEFHFVPVRGTALRLGDVDGDGDSDMFAIESAFDDFYVEQFSNDGSALFPMWTYDGLISDPLYAGRSAFGDIDLDGDSDMLIPIVEIGAADLYWNQDGEWIYQWDALPFDGDVELGDVDHDGLLDVVVAASSGELSLYLNRGVPQRPFWELVTNCFAPVTGAKPELGDIDGDGDLDLVVVTQAGFMNDLEVFSNIGGEHALAWHRGSDAYVLSGYYDASPTLGDIDGDGDADLFVADSDGTILFWRNQTPKLSVSPTRATLPTGGTASFVAASDTGPIEWSFRDGWRKSGDEGEATIGQDGVYVAGPVGGTVDCIEGRDADGLVGRAYITVVSEDDISAAGKAIIVAGQRGPDDYLWEATSHLGDLAYQTLRYRGFSPDNILYLSPGAERDVDGDGHSDTSDATVSNLGAALLGEWAGQADTLTLCLVDHGGSDEAGTAQFRLSAGESLIARSDDGETGLDVWLDRWQSNGDGNRRATVIVDACESGSFLDELQPPEGMERIVIASAAEGEPSYFVAGGLVSFSGVFWQAIASGHTVGLAFGLAADAMSYFQQAKLDDNGDGRYEPETDGDVALERYIGPSYIPGADRPQIGQICGNQTVESGASAEIWADDVSGPYTIKRVWAIVVPPDIETDPENAVTDLPEEALLFNSNTDRWEAVLDGLTGSDPYAVIIYAEDVWGGVSMPKMTYVVPAEFDERVIVVAGEGAFSETAPWEATDCLAQYAYETFVHRLLDDPERVYFLHPTADGDGHGDVNGPPTVDALEEAIRDWANGADKLSLYFVGHGEPGGFQLSSEELLAPGELNVLLNAFQNSQDEANQQALTVVFDASCSGSWVEALSAEGRERLVIASARGEEEAYCSPDGRVSFSQFFLNEVFMGHNLRTAFAESMDALAVTIGEWEFPQLDDNGGETNEILGDGELAGTLHIGSAFRTGADLPIIGDTSGSVVFPEGGSVQLWASDVSDADEIERVWATVVAVDDDSEGGNGATTVELHRNAVTQRHEGWFEDPSGVGPLTLRDDGMTIAVPRSNESGVTDVYRLVFDTRTWSFDRVLERTTRHQAYRVAYYAQDGEGNVTVRSDDDGQTDVAPPTFAPEPEQGDRYEEDDTYWTANVIFLGDDGQEHDFHDPGDADWVKFFAVNGTHYVIETTDLGEDCVTGLRLYDDQMRLVMERHSWWAQDFARLSWACEQDGIYYVEVTHLDPSVSGTGTEYRLRAYVPTVEEACYVSGIVRDSVTNQGIPDVLVRGDIGGEAITDKDGIYKLSVAPGSYIITASAKGYRSHRTSRLRLSSGLEPAQSFALRPRGGVVRTYTIRYADADGDEVVVTYTGSASNVAIIRELPFDTHADAEEIVLSGTTMQDWVTITVSETGTVADDGTTIGRISGSGIGRLDMPQVTMNGNTIELTGPLGSLVVDRIEDGSDIILGGDATNVLTVEAREVGDVDLTFPGMLTEATVQSWAAGQIIVGEIGSFTTTDGPLGADLISARGIRKIDVNGDIAGRVLTRTDSPGEDQQFGTDDDGRTLDAAGSGTTGDIYQVSVTGSIAGEIRVRGDLGRQYRVRRRGRRRWVTEGLWCGGNVLGEIMVEGTAWQLGIDGQLRAALTIGQDAERIVLGQGASAAGDVTVGLGLTYFEAGGQTFAGDLKAGSIGEAYINSMNGLEGTIAATKQVDVNNDGDTNDAVDTAGNTGSITNLSMQNGTADGSTVTVEGDLGGLISYRRRGRRRWRTVGFWSGGDVLSSVVVAGHLHLFEIADTAKLGGTIQAGSMTDVRVLGGMTQTGRIETLRADDGAGNLATTGDVTTLTFGGTVEGDVEIGGHLGTLEVGYRTGRRGRYLSDASFTGTLEAGSIGYAYWHASNGIEGEVNVVKTDVNNDGDTDDAVDTSGNVDALYVYSTSGQIQQAVHIEGDAKAINAYGGTSADGDITVDGVLGGMQSYRRRGRRRVRLTGFWSGGDVLGDISATGEAYLIDIDGDLANASIAFEPLDTAATGWTTSVEIAGCYQWNESVSATAPGVRGTSGLRAYLLTITEGGVHNGAPVLAPVLDQLVSNSPSTWLLWDTGDEAGHTA